MSANTVDPTAMVRITAVSATMSPEASSASAAVRPLLKLARAPANGWDGVKLGNLPIDDVLGVLLLGVPLLDVPLLDVPLLDVPLLDVPLLDVSVRFVGPLAGLDGPGAGEDGWLAPDDPPEAGVVPEGAPCAGSDGAGSLTGGSVTVGSLTGGRETEGKVTVDPCEAPPFDPPGM